MNTGVTVHLGNLLHLTGDPEDEGIAEYFEKGALAVSAEGYVAAAGNAEQVCSGFSEDTVIVDHGDHLIVPGFVDTHIHYPQCGIIAAHGTQLLDWLNRYTFPEEERFEDVGFARRTAAFFLDELLRNGTTTALVFGTVHPQSVDAFFEECRNRKMRMLCGKVMMDRNAPAYLLDTPESSYEDSAALIERWHGSERLLYAVTPRFAPTSSSAQLKFAGRLLEQYPGVRLQTHLAENTTECTWVSELFPHRRDYVDVYEQHGLLGPNSVFAHGIHLNEREWSRLSATASSLSFCPCSNLFIGSGLFNLSSADRHGVKVGLGTDVGGGDSFSLLRTVNEAYKVLQLGGQNLDPMRALYLATLGGAKALGVDGQIGNFETGKEADFVVLDTAATPLLEYRNSRCENVDERLFITLMLGDDRCVAATYVMGRRTVGACG